MVLEKNKNKKQIIIKIRLFFNLLKLNKLKKTHFIKYQIITTYYYNILKTTNNFIQVTATTLVKPFIALIPLCFRYYNI